MKFTNMFLKTFREDPAGAEINSHRLLVRAGYIRQVGNGIFSYMPIGLKVLENIKKIIREEMNNAGAIELQMPILLPQEIYQKRINTFGNTILYQVCKRLLMSWSQTVVFSCIIF